MKRAMTFLSIIAFSILLIDSRSVVAAARDGLTLCIQSVIPSLLPFMVFSAYLRARLSAYSFAIMKPIRKLLRIPSGAEVLWLIGTLGGYPIGAYCINEAYRKSQISKKDARRMLGFCCNCGPAFIFGIVGALMENYGIILVIWTIHVISSLISGYMMPTVKSSNRKIEINQTSGSDILISCIKSTATVCTWVILFRVAISYIQKIGFIKQTPAIMAFVTGILELTNGCLSISSISKEGAKFIIVATMLAFGGLCVLIQTVSVTEDVGLGLYFPGKMIQTTISFMLALVTQMFLFPDEQQLQLPFFIVILLLILCVAIILVMKKSCSIPNQDDV